MAKDFSDFDFDEFNETFSGADDGSSSFEEGKHMRRDPQTPRHAAADEFGYDLDNFDEQEKTRVYPAEEEPVSEPSADYGDDFYASPETDEDEDDRTVVFDKVQSDRISSDMRAGRMQREQRELEKDKRANGVLIAAIVISAVILVGLIIFLVVFMTSGKSKKAETTPTATIATQVTEKQTEKPTEKPTQAKPTQAPKPTEAPRTQAPEPTQAIETQAPVITPTEAPEIPTEAPVTPDDDTPSNVIEDSTPVIDADE